MGKYVTLSVIFVYSVVLLLKTPVRCANDKSLKKVDEECASKYLINVTEQQMLDTIKRRPGDPVSDGVKQFFICFFDRLGLIDAEGEPDLGAIEKLAAVETQEHRPPFVTTFLNKCVPANLTADKIVDLFRCMANPPTD